MERAIGNDITRILADAGYPGQNAPISNNFRVYTFNQRSRMSPAIKRDMRCHSALDPIIGYIKNDHQMNSNSFARPQGDSINAVLAAADYNSGLLLN